MNFHSAVDFGDKQLTIKAKKMLSFSAEFSHRKKERLSAKFHLPAVLGLKVISKSAGLARNQLIFRAVHDMHQ